MLTVFHLIVAATAAERLAELIVSARNARWALARGGVERGRRHFPPMVALHTALILAPVIEVHLARRPFVPAVGWTAIAVVLAAQVLRWWCIASLGRQWNTRVIVVPGLPLVRSGPYRWLRHPNYVAVVAEGAALPLIHSAWMTALGFTALNAWLLLGARIPAEERALTELAAPLPAGGLR